MRRRTWTARGTARGTVRGTAVTGVALVALAAVAAVAALVALAAAFGFPVVTPGLTGRAGPGPSAATAEVVRPGAPAAAPETCSPPATASYPPLASLPAPGRMPPGTLMAAIAARGHLVVGVSGDTRLLGARNSLAGGRLEGFDIDVARQVAAAIFGDPSRVRFVVITGAQRIPLVNQGAGTAAQPRGGVDLVARAMTMNCDRWNNPDPAKRVAFSSVYLLAHQRILVRSDSPAQNINDLARARARVCAPTASTSLARIQGMAGVRPVPVEIHSDCLALLQEGRVDAITGDDAILAGFADQDPHLVIRGGSLEDEPYGLAVSRAHPEFVQFVNAVLERIRRDGTWASLYDRWLRGSLGPASPPQPSYGRTP